MKTIHNTNKALLRVLGLDDMKFIQSVDVALRPRQLPEVTVRMTVDLADGTDTQVFRLIAPLTSTPRPALDLDAMCLQAQQRVQEHIEELAYRAWNQCRSQHWDRAQSYTGFVRELIENDTPF